MNVWTNCSFGLGYYCSLSQLITFKESENHEIEVDSSQPRAICHFPEQIERASSKELQPLLNRKLKNILKQGAVPILKNKTCTFEQKGHYQKLSSDEVLKSCEQAIQKLRFLVQRDELDHPDTLVCPITLSLFEEPVSDNHGHTFESHAIKASMQTSPSCPLNRQPITTLVPNLSIKGIVDTLRAEPLIPLLPCMKGEKAVEDSVKAASLFGIAKSDENEGNYKDALDMYARGFAYTNKIEDYEPIPLLLIKNKEPLKAALAYLYLAMRAIQEGKTATSYLEACLEQAPNEKVLLALKGSYLLFQGENLKASQVFCSLAKTLEKKEALTYFEQALQCCPLNEQLYYEIAQCVDDEAKIRLFVLGFSSFHRENPSLSEQFYQKAFAQDPRNPLIAFARLNQLPKKDSEKIEIYRRLADIFMAKQDQKRSISSMDKVLAKAKINPHEVQQYVDYLIENGNPEMAEEIALRYFTILYPVGEAGVLEAIQKFGRKIPFLEKLLVIYEKEKNLNALEKLIPELASHYELQQNNSALESIFRIAHKELCLAEYSLKLGKALTKQNKNSESVRIYYDLSLSAYNKKEMAIVSLCLEKMNKLNAIAYLAPHEQQALSMQSFTIELFQKLAENHDEMKNMQQQHLQSLQMVQQVLSQELTKIHQEIIAGQDKLLLQMKETQLENNTLQKRELAILNRRVQAFEDRFNPEKLGVGLNAEGRVTALIEACSRGEVGQVRELLFKGTKVNGANHLRETPLSCAVKNGHLEIAELLIKNGADANQIKLDYGKTGHSDSESPLTVACKAKNLEMVKLLLKYKAKVEVWREGYCIPDHVVFAVETDSPDIIELFCGYLKQDHSLLTRALVVATKGRLGHALKCLLSFYNANKDDKQGRPSISNGDAMYQIADYDMMNILSSYEVKSSLNEKVIENGLRHGMDAVCLLMKAQSLGARQTDAPSSQSTLLFMAAEVNCFQVFELMMDKTALSKNGLPSIWHISFEQLLVSMLTNYNLWDGDVEKKRRTEVQIKIVRWLAEEKKYNFRGVTVAEPYKNNAKVNLLQRLQDRVSVEVIDLLKKYGAT